MEKTVANRELFIVQYWGQKVLRRHGWVDEKYNQVVGIKTIAQNIPQTYLELKPVSMLTEEEATELVKIKFEQDKGVVSDITGVKVKVFRSKLKPHAISIEAVVSHKSWADFVERIFISNETRNNSALIDYLRSRGYALNWRDLSIEKQLQYNWIKLPE